MSACWTTSASTSGTPRTGSRPRATVARAFEQPDLAAYDGWEPLTACRERVVPAVRRVLDVHPGEDVVLVGHGTAWTLVVAALAGEQPDLDAWERMRMPDLIVLPR